MHVTVVQKRSTARGLANLLGALLAFVAATVLSSTPAWAETPSAACNYMNQHFNAGYTQSSGSLVYDPGNFKPGERIAYDITSPDGGTLEIYGPVNATVSTMSGTGEVTVTSTATTGLRIGVMTVMLHCLQPINNTYLWSLGLSSGSLVPSFHYLTNHYTASVPNSTSSLTLTPTTDDPAASITINGAPVTGATFDEPLQVGANTITIVVTSASGLATRTFTLTVSRQAGSPVTNANLSDLVLSTGALTPVFSASTTSYTQDVANDVSSVTVTPTTDDASATVTVNGSPLAPGLSTTVSLDYGPNTITAVVTAQDRATTKTYTTVITREPNAGADNNNLSNLVMTGLTPAFNSDITSYTVTTASTAPISLTPTLADSNASLTVNGNARPSGVRTNLSYPSSGTGTFTVKVFAQNGVPKTYTIAFAATAYFPTLTGISLSEGTLSPSYDQAVTSYTASVASNVTSLTVTPTAATGNQVTINGSVVASGAASSSIALSLGQTTIPVVVRSRAGNNTKTYNVVVTRGGLSADANLSGLSLSTGAVSPAFSAATTSYSVLLPVTATSITVTPTLSDANATVTVNGNAVASGSASSAISIPAGNSTITTVVTAQDGTTTKTYTVAVNRIPNSDNYLSALSVSAGTLSPAFNATEQSYSFEVPNTVTSMSVTPTLADTNATVTVESSTVASGTASNPIPLGYDRNRTITVVVTAENGGTRTYELHVARNLGSSADLTSLVLSNGTLSPAFDGENTDTYSATVPYSVSSITVTPTAEDANATISVQNNDVASGATSDPIALPNVGDTPNTIYLVVTPQDGVAPKVYTVNVTREAQSSNANLSALGLGSGSLSPAFDAATTNYTATVDNSVDSLTVTPTLSDVNASVTVNGNTVPSGSASDDISLNVGENTITTVVTAQDGTTQKTYTIIVTRADDSDATNAELSNLVLSSGTLSPVFDGVNTDTYSATVPHDVSSITITPTAANANATITIHDNIVASGAASGPIALDNIGDQTNLITVSVTSQDGGTNKGYLLLITRQGAANADLASLAVSSGTLSPAFDTATTTYTATVANSVTTYKVTPTLSDVNASVTVNGNTVPSGNASDDVYLNVGENTITTVVTAQDGQTQKTYTLTVTRQPPIVAVNADLTALTVSDTTLSPTFNPAQVNYTATLPWYYGGVVVTPFVADGNATVTVNGTPVTSGSASNPISMNTGENTITIVVTGADHTTTKQYQVVVTREVEVRSSNANLASLATSAGTLTPAFDPGITSYTVAVDNSVTAIDFEGYPADPNAIAILFMDNQQLPYEPVRLNVGVQTISIIVIAPDQTTYKVYDVAVTRAPAANADLTGLAVSAGTLSPTFDPATINYTASVANSVYTYTVTPTLSDATATVTVNGTAVTSGSASGQIVLDVGANTITTVVTANDAQTQKTYTLVVTRAAAASITFNPASGALPDAMAGEAYAAGITTTANPANTPIFTISSGTLPTGLTLNVSTGELTGPLDAASAGSYAFTISVTDEASNSGSASYTLTVLPRAITVTDKTQPVDPGSPPPNVYLNRDATGGPFTSAQIVSITPANAGTATIVLGDLAATTYAGPFGYYLKYVPAPAFKGQVKIGYVLSSSLGTSNVGTVTYTVAYDAVAVAKDIDSKVQSFVKARQNLVAQSAKVPGLLERRRMSQSTKPVATRASPSGEEGASFGIATSLAELRSSKRGGAVDTQKLNIWIDGTLMAQKRDETNSDWGSFGMLSIGADYLLSPTALIGLSLHMDHMVDPTSSEAALRGTGWLAGPYASFELVPNVFFDTSLLYGGSSNDIDTTFFDGGFDTNRWMWSAKLTGQWRLNETTLLTPKIAAAYLNEKVEDYAVGNTLGDSIAIAGFTEEQLRLSIGADIEKQYLLANGLVLVPRVGATAGVASLDNSGLFGSLTTGLSLSDGMNWNLDAALILNLENEGQISTGGKLGGAVRF